MVSILKGGKQNEYGDFYPQSLTDKIKTMISDVCAEFREDDPYWHRSMELDSKNARNANKVKLYSQTGLQFNAKEIAKMIPSSPEDGPECTVPSTTEQFNWQRKISPWDEIETEYSENNSIRARTKKEVFAASAKKQDIIVVASLIDKVPNLAGLARTCEIFRASKLVVRDLKVKKLDLFRQISVTVCLFYCVFHLITKY